MTTRRFKRIHLIAAWTLTVVCGPVAIAQQRVVDTVHNLSSSGPGDIRAESEEQVCIFCHAPHSTGGERPLWNRAYSVASYTIYQSSTFDASPGQPTGSSKLCLSCHDGTIALGAVLSRMDRIRMVGGDYMPAGLSHLGTDLSDDHPISFHYTSGLAASDGQLNNPAALPEEVPLDDDGQLQCTSCHDAHHNRYRKFLTQSDEYGELCIICHAMDGWNSSSHETSNVSITNASNGDWPYQTVAQNACRSCHRSHTAGGRERLLIFEAEEENCLNCHDGSAAEHDITSQINKTSAHDPRLYLGLHDPVETLAGGQPHVECVDCHNPHASAPATDMGYVPIGGTMAKIPGITSGGAYVPESQFEYEVCYRCHGDSPVVSETQIPRQVSQPNLRLKFAPSAISTHPVVVANMNQDTVSLDPSITLGALIRCTDCHNNDSGPRVGGAGPDGPHGSIYDYLLERNYTVRDDTPESSFEYAMCYKCHQRSSILGNQSFPYHATMIQQANAPCSACHDPHGVSSTAGTGSDHTHLINFDTTIVRPLTSTGQLRFSDDGRFVGSCTLTCHGRDHDNQEYGN